MICLRSHNDQRINQELSLAVSHPHTLLSLIKIPQRVCYVRTLLESRIDGSLRPSAATSKSWGKGWVPAARGPRRRDQSAQLVFASSRGRPLPSPALPDLNQAVGLVACAEPVQTDLGGTRRDSGKRQGWPVQSQGHSKRGCLLVVLTCRAASCSFLKMHSLQPIWPLLPHQNLLCEEASGIRNF